MRSIAIKAPAKINLNLKVFRPCRPDGFHEVRTILQAIALADVVEVTLAREAGLGLTCTDPAVPTDDSNLAIRAAVQFVQAVGYPAIGIGIHIRKGIPMAAGLGGGSADAAATLVGLRTLLAPEMADGQLESIGADLGSDVPFFIRGGTQVGLGRGDMLAPARQPLSERPVVIVKPAGGCSTREVYSRYDRGIGGGDDAPALDDALEALSVGRLEDAVGNDLRPAAIAIVAEVGDAIAALRDCGLSPVEMSGSGSACFGFANSEEQAVAAARALSERFPFARACMTWASGCEVLRE